MPYGRRGVSGLRGTRSTHRRTGRRGGFGRRLSRVRYQAPSARNQRTQIYSNTRAILRNSRLIKTHRVYCDWQLEGLLTDGMTDAAWTCVPLVDPSAWTSVLRTDANVAESSHTFIKRMVMNLRFFLGTKDMCTFNVFIVTMRPNATGLDPNVNPNAALVLGEAWIENSQDQGAAIRLNSNIFKVHYSKYVTLTMSTLGQTIPSSGPAAGNPYSTWRKAQCSLALNVSATNPSIGAPDQWKQLTYEQFPAHQRYYLLCYKSQRGAGTDPAGCTYDSLFTTVNAS